MTGFFKKLFATVVFLSSCCFCCFCCFQDHRPQSEYDNLKKWNRVLINKFILSICPNLVSQDDYLVGNMENLKIILNNNRQKFIDFLESNKETIIKESDGIDFLYTTENWAVDGSNIFYTKENKLWINIAIQQRSCCGNFPTHIPIELDLAKEILI